MAGATRNWFEDPVKPYRSASRWRAGGDRDDEPVGKCQHCGVKIFDRDDSDRHQDAMSHLCWKCVKPHGVEMSRRKAFYRKGNCGDDEPVEDLHSYDEDEAADRRYYAKLAGDYRVEHPGYEDGYEFARPDEDPWVEVAPGWRQDLSADAEVYHHTSGGYVAPLSSGKGWKAQHSNDWDDYSIAPSRETAMRLVSGGLLDDLREIGDAGIEGDLGAMAERNDRVRDAVDAANEAGYDASQFVASAMRRYYAAGRHGEDGPSVTNWDPRHPDDRWERDDPRGQDHMPNYQREGRAVELPDASDEDLVLEMLRNRAPHGRVGDGDKDWDDEVVGEFGRRASWFGQLAAAPEPAEAAAGDHLPFNGSGNAPSLEFGSTDAWVEEHESAGLVDVADLGDGGLPKAAKIVDVTDGDGVIKYSDDDKPQIERFAEFLPPGWGGNPSDPGKDESFPLPPGLGPVVDAVKALPLPLGELGQAVQAGQAASAVTAGTGPRAAKRIGGGSAPAQNFSVDDIAANAQAFLRTAGRVYSAGEQRSLEEESHPLGARNLDGLELDGTHYLS